MNKLHFITRYDPRTPRDLSTLKIDGFTVQRNPLRGTPHVRYSIFADDELLGHQITFPSQADCQSLANIAGFVQRTVSRAAPAQRKIDTRTLTERIVLTLKEKEMGVGDLGTRLERQPDFLSPILTRLVRAGLVSRRRVGEARPWLYRAA